MYRCLRFLSGFERTYAQCGRAWIALVYLGKGEIPLLNDILTFCHGVVDHPGWQDERVLGLDSDPKLT
jgi:hypothetical protein